MAEHRPKVLQEFADVTSLRRRVIVFYLMNKYLSVCMYKHVTAILGDHLKLELNSISILELDHKQKQLTCISKTNHKQAEKKTKNALSTFEFRTTNIL